MDTSCPRITVPEPWISWSHKWGKLSVLGYERGEKEASRKYARPNIDKDPKWQILGKMGECAYALYLDLIPSESVDWTLRPDKGNDLYPPKQLKDHLVKHVTIDVKASNTDYLIWPVTKDFKSPAYMFALAVPVETSSATFDLCGWVTVEQFMAYHDTAPPPDWFDVGTPHLHRSLLWPATDLIASNALEIIRSRAELKIVKPPQTRLPDHPQTEAERAGYPNGFVGYDAEGRFIHYCHCGEWGSFGTGCFLRCGKLGIWFCREHRPLVETAKGVTNA